MENWIWGMCLIVLTVGLHASGVVSTALVLHNIWIRVENQSLGLRDVFAIWFALISSVGLLLAALQVIEAGVWAAVYSWLGAFTSPSEAILYSIDSMTTRGASGLELPEHWRMMGALESVCGLLLFGISTAYIFAVMQVYWPLFAKGRRWQ